LKKKKKKGGGTATECPKSWGRRGRLLRSFPVRGEKSDSTKRKGPVVLSGPFPRKAFQKGGKKRRTTRRFGKREEGRIIPCQITAHFAYFPVGGKMCSQKKKEEKEKGNVLLFSVYGPPSGGGKKEKTTGLLQEEGGGKKKSNR